MIARALLVTLVLLGRAGAVPAAEPRVFYLPSGFPDERAVDLTKRGKAPEFCRKSLRGLELAREALGVKTCSKPGDPARRPDAPLDVVLLVDDRDSGPRLRELISDEAVNRTRPRYGRFRNSSGSFVGWVLIVRESAFRAGDVSDAVWQERVRSALGGPPGANPKRSAGRAKEGRRRDDDSERYAAKSRSEDARSIHERIDRPGCKYIRVRIPESYSAFESRIREWIAGCVIAGERPGPDGEPWHREREDALVPGEGRRSLIHVWFAVKDRSGEVGIRARYKGTHRVEDIDYYADIPEEERPRISAEDLEEVRFAQGARRITGGLFAAESEPPPRAPGDDPFERYAPYFQAAESYVKTIVNIADPGARSTASFRRHLLELPEGLSPEGLRKSGLPDSRRSSIVPPLSRRCYADRSDPRQETDVEGCRAALAAWLDIAVEEREAVREDFDRLCRLMNRKYREEAERVGGYELDMPCLE